MTIDEEDREAVWKATLASIVADKNERDKRAAAIRAAFAERRTHGLAARHATKLARNHPGTTTEPPRNHNQEEAA